MLRKPCPCCLESGGLLFPPGQGKGQLGLRACYSETIGSQQGHQLLTGGTDSRISSAEPEGCLNGAWLPHGLGEIFVLLFSHVCSIKQAPVGLLPQHRAVRYCARSPLVGASLWTKLSLRSLGPLPGWWSAPMFPCHLWALEWGS